MLGFSALCDSDGRMLLVDRGTLSRGNATLDDVQGRPFWDGPWWAHDDVVQSWMKDACHAAAQGETRRREIRASLPDGSMLWMDFQVRPLKDEHGAISYIVPSGIDISALQERQARIDTLLGEVNHRTKNLLAIVQSVSRQIAARAKPEDVATEISRRIGSLSTTQDMIIRSNWTAVDLAELARAQLLDFGDLPSDLVELEGERVLLSPQAAQTMGLALFELGCGGATRLAQSGEPRSFRLRWVIEGDRFRMTWTEADGEMAPRPPPSSFSELVLDQMTSAALGGKTGWNSTDRKRCWSLNCPMSKIFVPESPQLGYFANANAE